MKIEQITTLGQLKKSGYKPKNIKEELRQNLIASIKEGYNPFPDIQGFDDTVLPDLKRAILSRHNILLLGLRGQAKTSIARMMVNLLDEYIPAVKDSPLDEDPMNPITTETKEIISNCGDDTPIKWIHRSERYVEKLATPDVSIADLIGDLDPIKAANLKLSYSNEKAIHFGLIPRAHRSIFVLNELPDLQPRIQVSLFNILQEGDIQIRGFKLRLLLDIQFVFTANPEDYTNRGSIITPLKDRIESQILTHYPTTLEVAKNITASQAQLHDDQSSKVKINDLHRDLIEMIVFEARESELVDEKSGVSARLAIAALENLVSTAELRMIENKEDATATRITDFWGVIPAITGKLELVYEGEQEGPYNVAIAIIDKAIKKLFLQYFRDPTKTYSGKDPFGALKVFFADGQKVRLLNNLSNDEYYNTLSSLPGMKKIIDAATIPQTDDVALMELVLFGLVSFEILQKYFVENAMTFEDPLGSYLDEE